jgi:hypothetical protein
MPEIVFDNEKLIDKYRLHTEKENAFDSVQSDMFAVNKRLIKGEAVNKIEMVRAGRTIEVHLSNAKISIDGKELDLGLTEKPKNIRWINFNRVSRGYGMTDSQVEQATICILGFQGNYKDGKNIKRMAAVYATGRVELWGDQGEILQVI